ncbi:MAG TPA: hypothetical protein VJ749_09325 [Pyrinomonadaceae bacterium]|nr:hypothetical protein [Pyrinomonadaceae bacterium]
MTRRINQICVPFIVALAALRLVHAQHSRVGAQSPVQPQQSQTRILNTEPPPMRLRTPETIIESFLKTETQLRQALNQHTFKREVVLQTIGPNGEVTGQYIRNSEFLFDDRGKRIERVTYHPPSTIREMRITREDIQDLAGAQLLGIDITESAKYRLAYRGEELLDGKRVYVLNVEPVVHPNPYRMSERYFRGAVWIDAATYQMVRVRGTVEPQGKQRFPQFETWREILSTPDRASSDTARETTDAPNSVTLNDSNPQQPIDTTLVSRNQSETNTAGNVAFAFPSRTEADDVLHFPNRDVNYRIRVRYYDYKLFASTLSVKELDQPATLDQPRTLTARIRP